MLHDTHGLLPPATAKWVRAQSMTSRLLTVRSVLCSLRCWSRQPGAPYDLTAQRDRPFLSLLAPPTREDVPDLPWQLDALTSWLVPGKRHYRLSIATTSEDYGYYGYYRTIYLLPTCLALQPFSFYPYTHLACHSNTQKTRLPCSHNCVLAPHNRPKRPPHPPNRVSHNQPHLASTTRNPHHHGKGRPRPVRVRGRKTD